MNRIRGHISGDDAPCPNDASPADRDAFENYGAGTYPDIVLDDYGLVVLGQLFNNIVHVCADDICPMVARHDCHVWPKKDFAPNRYRACRSTEVRACPYKHVITNSRVLE